MNFLLSHWGVCVAILTVCSLYFCWKINGGMLFDFFNGKNNGSGSASVLGEILLFIGYIGFSVGMIGIAAIVGLVMRVILVITAIAAFKAGQNDVGAACLAFTIGTAVISFGAYRFSKARK